MCGIVGIMDLSGARPIDRDLIARMNDTQIHRGPDEVGVHVEPGLGFGHRRLFLLGLLLLPLGDIYLGYLISFNLPQRLVIPECLYRGSMIPVG